MNMYGVDFENVPSWKQYFSSAQASRALVQIAVTNDKCANVVMCTVHGKEYSNILPIFSHLFDS